MKTTLNEALTQLKLKHSKFSPNLNEVLTELKTKEINYYRTKVVSLSESILRNPHNVNQQHAELQTSLNQLERSLIA